MDITHSAHGINEKCRPDEIILNIVLQKRIAEAISGC
jgi:hypothetical protein